LVILRLNMGCFYLIQLYDKGYKMKTLLNYLLLGVVAITMMGCGGGSSNTQTSTTPYDTALAKITAYADTQGNSEAPTLQDYADVNVVGVDDTNLLDVNEAVKGLNKEDVDTTEEIQTLADALGVTVPATTPSHPTSDTTPPVITLSGANPANVTQNTSYTDAGATANDAVDGVVTVNTTGTVDATTLGDYTLTYTATDSAGNTATATRTVTVTALTITHNGTTYGVVTSPYTGKVWLDRNLGAARVCTSFNDTACYGDYYQWGRNFDGHQDSTSATTSIQAADVNSAGTNFITSGLINNFDWANTADSNGSLRSSNWSKIDGSSVCPVGFRVPNRTELEAETINSGVTDRNTAFLSFLKLPSAGFRISFDGIARDVGFSGYVYSSQSNNSNRAFQLYLSLNQAAISLGGAAGGASVRCLKN
jgi:hypothetical protein